MSGRIFQNVVLQLKENTDRTVGVIDGEGIVIACSELSMIGQRWAEYVPVVNSAAGSMISSDGKTFKALAGWGNQFDYAVFAFGDNEVSKTVCALATVSLNAAKAYYEEKHDRGTFIKDIISDNIMLGAYSQDALSGVALVNQIQFILQMLTMGVGEGIVVLGAQFWGKRDTEPIKRITNCGLRIGLVISLLLWAAVFFFPHFCLSLFTNEERVIAEGMQYLRIICFSYPLFAFTNILLCSLRSVETVRIGFFVSLSTLMINVGLNYVLIFGNFGAPRMGSAGAAAATLTARAVEAVIVTAYLLLADKKLRLRPRDFLRLDHSLFKRYLKVGLPVIISNGLWGIGTAVQTAILGHMGDDAIAANSVASVVFQILTVVVYGAANASSIIIGKTIGQGAEKLVRLYAKTLQVLYLLLGVATGLCLFLVRDWVLGFYVISPESKQLASEFMMVLSVTCIGTAYQMSALTGIVRGGGDTKFVLFNDMIFVWLVVIPLSSLAAFVWGLPPMAVFIFLKCDQVLKCFVAAVKVNRFRWIRRLTD